MKLNWNNTMLNEGNYRLRLDREDQKAVGKAYGWFLEMAADSDRNELQDTLFHDFVVLSLIGEEERPEQHETYLNVEEVDELKDILSAHQQYMDENDRPVIGDRNNHNHDWPYSASGVLSRAIMNNLVYLQMNTMQDRSHA